MYSTTIDRYDQFAHRHIGPGEEETRRMLETIGAESLDQLIDETVPAPIRVREPLDVPRAMSEVRYLIHLREIAARNEVFRNYIGMGYYGTVTPSVISRNVFQNPGWYTQYTPYQAEIAQGRLEALLNFQTVVSDLTGLPIANASLLDEATAAAEAMSLFYAQKNKRKRATPANVFLVSDLVFPQTIDVLRTRAEPIGVEVRVLPVAEFVFDDSTFGILLQYPAGDGSLDADYRAICERAVSAEVYTVVAADLLALTMLQAPGTWGADAVVGNTQRFGVPMGFGGPHAAYFAIKEDYKRQLPGRIIGISKDRHGDTALRMALQTREQHIRREKATSNICTAQALLAIMAGMYAVYHGPEGLRAIAERVHQLAARLARTAGELGYTLASDTFFDTIELRVDQETQDRLRTAALANRSNLYYGEGFVRISLDETIPSSELDILTTILRAGNDSSARVTLGAARPTIPTDLQREVDYLTHPNFHRYRTETQMMRYLKRLENKDLSLVHSMIPLGSCTMKLNAATELMPVSWAAFANIHPFAPAEQTGGYRQMLEELERYLSVITGFTACSLSLIRVPRASMPACSPSAPTTGTTDRRTVTSHSSPSRPTAPTPLVPLWPAWK